MNILESVSTIKQNANLSPIRILCQERLHLYYNKGSDIYISEVSVRGNVSGFPVVGRLFKTVRKFGVTGEPSWTFVELLVTRHAVNVTIMNGRKKFIALFE